MNATIAHTEGYYLIVTMLPNEPLAIEKIFSDLWSLYIVNVCVLTVPDERSDSDITVYTYIPFEANRCEKVRPIVVNYFINGSFVHTNDFFPDKLRDMNGCEIVISVYNYEPFVVLKSANGQLELSGIDGSILNIISKVMNFTIVLNLVKAGVHSDESLKMVQMVIG